MSDLLAVIPASVSIPKRDRGGHITQADRFWEKVDASGDCWEWTAATTNGYGVLNIDYSIKRAHRLAWELLVGPIPPGLEIDHLCRNRICVNPDHLEPVTGAENLARGVRSNQHKGVTHCVNGHLFDAANTYIRPNGSRSCRTCTRLRMRRYRANARNRPS